MADVRIETWERLPFDESTDIVEVSLNVYGNEVKVVFILSAISDTLLLKGFLPNVGGGDDE